MSQLYTVKMLRKRTIYSYDPHTGLRVNERNDHVEITITDLPMRTALAYKFKCADNNPRIIPQEHSVDVVRFSKSRNYYERDDAPAPVASEDMVHATSSVVSAAISGDMSAALNEEAA